MPAPSPPDSRYAGRRVLVLGATGFIGAWVARRLSQAGARLHLTWRSEPGGREVQARYGIEGEGHALDLADADALGRLVGALGPEVVFNLAGYGVQPMERDEADAQRVNVESVVALATALAALPASGSPGSGPAAGPCLVHVGSGFEYGPIGGDLDEESPPAPESLYARSKLEATRRLAAECARTGLRAVTARPFTVYGPGEGPHRLLPSLMAAAASGEEVALSAGTQRRDFIHVEDVAEGLLRLGVADTRPGEAVNLATGVLTSVRGFAEIAASELGIPAERLRFGALPSRGGGEDDHDPVSIRRLRERTAWQPGIAIAEGVARTAGFLAGDASGA